MFFLHECSCNTCIIGNYGRQKRTSDPTELKLQMTMSHHVGVRNQTWIFVGAISTLNHRVISPAPDCPCREKKIV